MRYITWLRSRRWPRLLEPTWTRGRLPGGVQLARGQRCQARAGRCADGGCRCTKLVQLLFVAGPFSQVAGRAVYCRHYATTARCRATRRAVAARPERTGPCRSELLSGAANGRSPVRRRYGAQIQPMPRGLRGERCKARHGLTRVPAPGSQMGASACWAVPRWAPPGRCPAPARPRLPGGRVMSRVSRSISVP